MAADSKIYRTEIAGVRYRYDDHPVQSYIKQYCSAGMTVFLRPSDMPEFPDAVGVWMISFRKEIRLGWIPKKRQYLLDAIHNAWQHGLENIPCEIDKIYMAGIEEPHLEVDIKITLPKKYN